MSYEKSLKTCEHCGVEFMGGPLSRFCPDCKRMKIAHMDKRESTTVKGDGWRHMYRDNTGTVIRAGGNVMHALDDLCAYEEACEEAGIRGPEELGQLLRFLVPDSGSLRKMVEGAKKWEREQKDADCRGLRPRNDSGGKASDGQSGSRRRSKEGSRFCENCGHFSRIEGTGRGICGKHPKLLRPEGRGGPLYLVPGEHREVQARRKACGDFTGKDGGADSSTAPAAPLRMTTGETPPEWIGPSAELMPKEGE